MITSKNKITNSDLLIIGHGHSNTQDSTRLIKGHAKAIEKRNIFKNVQSGFLKLAPYIVDQLSTTKSEIVYVVPCFASSGDITKEVIPRKLGLLGPKTIKDGKIIYYSEPVGTHPKILKRLSELIKITFEFSGLSKCNTTSVIIGHGSKKNPRSEIDTRLLANKIEHSGLSQKVVALFLDQSPNLIDWHIHCKTKNVIVISYLFSGGNHEKEDIPKKMRFNPRTTKNSITVNRPIGPIRSSGKNLWLCPQISADPIVQDIIVERVIEISKP